MNQSRMTGLIASKGIDRLIREIRGERVMLDSDLASLYGVETRALNQAVQRNPRRFPPDFMFRLTAKEFDELRCQSGTSALRSQIGTLKLLMEPPERPTPRIGFASYLLSEPRGFRDVVIVHELLHLRIRNHGKLFKSLLNSFVPGWEKEIEGKANRICR